MARRLIVAPVDHDRRLDRWLARLDDGLPPSLIRRLLRQRRIQVNGRRTRDGAMTLAAGDQIEVHHDFTPASNAAVDARRWNLAPITVLHRDEDFLIVDKPAGIACSDDGEDPSALAVWLREYLAEELRAAEVRPEPCHRLDRGTTGIVAVALRPAAFDRFRRGLEESAVHKAYEVVVHGSPPSESFVCDTGLQRVDRAGRTEPRMIEGTALPACTEFRSLRTQASLSLLQARPLTGRTHQIRAHCLALGLPVVGDPRYGNPALAPGFDHQMLHARQLELTGGFNIECDWPPAELAFLRAHGLRG